MLCTYVDYRLYEYSYALRAESLQAQISKRFVLYHDIHVSPSMVGPRSMNPNNEHYFALKTPRNGHACVVFGTSTVFLVFDDESRGFCAVEARSWQCLDVRLVEQLLLPYYCSCTNGQLLQVYTCPVITTVCSLLTFSNGCLLPS